MICSKEINGGGSTRVGFSVAALSLVLLQLPLLAETPPKFMTQIEYINRQPSIPPDSFAAKPHKLWRAGEARLTSLEAPDYENGIHGLLITNEPHSWVVNLFSRSANHILDTSKDQTVHASVFSFARNETIRKLEFGSEISYFLERHAKRTRGNQVDGVLADQYDLDIDSVHLRLMVDPKKRIPLQIQMQDGKNDYRLDYLSFDDHVKFDPSVFKVPEGISVQETDSDQATRGKREPKNAWISDFITHYYEHPNPSRVADSFKAIKEDSMLDNSYMLTGFYAPIMRGNPEMIPSWIQTAKGLGPNMQRFIYFTLRQCGSEKCLAVLRQNPFSFDEQGVIVFSDLKPATIETMPLTSPSSLDFIWADFLATGSDIGVKRIVKLVGEKWPLFESENLHGAELRVVGAARWSLVSNAQQHPKVFNALKAESEHTPALKKIIDEVRSPAK